LLQYNVVSLRRLVGVEQLSGETGVNSETIDRNNQIRANGHGGITAGNDLHDRKNAARARRVPRSTGHIAARATVAREAARQRQLLGEDEPQGTQRRDETAAGQIAPEERGGDPLGEDDRPAAESVDSQDGGWAARGAGARDYPDREERGMTTDTKLKRGDYVRVRLAENEDWTEAFVALASDSQQSSVMLMMNGAVRTSNGGLIANALPLTVDYEAGTIKSLFGDDYEIEVSA
jgi:hypothetical protein